MAYTLTYSYNGGSQSYSVAGYTGEPVDVVVPDTYDDGVHGEHPVTAIREYAFRACSSLTSITIPDSVTIIETMAFDLCGSLTSITIPDSVTDIGERAFSNCSSLISITIPDSVISIGAAAFYGCNSLTSINILPKLVPILGNNVFVQINANAKFYCFQSAIDAYKTATNWNTYADKFVADDVRLYFVMNANSTKKYVDSADALKVNKTTEIAGIQINNGISANELMNSLFDVEVV